MFLRPIAAAVVAITCTCALPISAAPRIMEFQADNADTIEDEDGDNEDWIEIQNPDASPANLAGLSLTDDELLLTKWSFPAGVTIPPGGHLIVWASAKNRTNPAGPLHTNFKLNSAAGSYVALVAADGVTKLTEFANYPDQPPDRSFGTSFAVTTQTVISPGAACRWRVPAAAIANWNTAGFVDTAWTAASTGIGYDRSIASVNYLPLVGPGGNCETAMFNIRGTVYLRVPFTITDAAGVQGITLRMKYDDGFAAFINGTRLNPPAASATNSPATPVFDSIATAVRADPDAVLFESFDVSAQRSALINGTNVLAIQGLNQAPGSSDLIMVPELAISVVNPAAPETGYIAVPSPGVFNSAGTVQGFVDAPDFSVKRGFFTSPQTVALSTHTPGAQIRYTTNSSAPTATTGTVYSGPLTISGTTVLRAGAFVTGWHPSTVKTHTYIFASQVVNQPAAPAGFSTTWGNEYDFQNGTGFTGPVVPADYRMDPGVTGAAAYSALMVPALTTTLPVLSIATNATSLFGAATGIYSNGRLNNTELVASMEYFNPLDLTSPRVEDIQEDVGLRIHGGDALIEHPKKPFRVYFRKRYGADRLRYPLFPGSPVDSFDKLQLRPGGHDGWAVPFGSADVLQSSVDLARHATYVRDRFLRQCELDMGRLSVRGRYVHLYLNGLYWGFYDLHEVQSMEFFADHLGGEDADWDVVEHSNTSNPLFDIVDGNGAAMDAALALVRPPVSAGLPATYQSLQQYIDLNEFIDNLIVQMWGAQNDWMGPVFRGIPGGTVTDASRFFNKNWQAARRSRGAPLTGFHWQVWDAEISMGSHLILSGPSFGQWRVTDFNHTLIGTPASEIPRAAGTPGPAAEIYYALRKHNPAFRQRFGDRLLKHFFNDGALTTARMQARLQAFRNELDLPVVAESARWGDVNSGSPTVVTFTRDIHWRSEMDFLRNSYIVSRGQTLLNQFQAINLWPAVTAPSYSQHGGVVPANYALTITNPNAGGGVTYYTLDGTDPANPPGASNTVELAGPNNPCVYKIPSSQYANNSWKANADPADIGTWTAASAGLGFDANPTFGPHIVSTVTGMQGVNPSCYVRIPFNVTAAQKANMTSLTLNLKYDDGVFVFLNGSAPLARMNAPLSDPEFDDIATAQRADSSAINYQAIDLTSQIASLNTATPNLLAFQGLNVTAADDDFLCVPQVMAGLTTPAGPAPGAQLYAGPVTLTQSRTVKARVLLNGAWSPLLEASFIVGVPASASNLTITEFSYNPAPPSAAEIAAGFTTAQMFEFLELMNISGSMVQLTGVRFDDGVTFDFSTHASVQQLLPGQRIVLASHPAALQMRHPGVSVAGTFAEASNLSNSGERIELLAAGGAPIVDFVYDDNPPWPGAPDGGGFSLVLINPTADPDPAVPSNWRASTGPGGTPGGSDADTYAAWAARTPVTGGMGGDANGNGLSNLVEYGLGLPQPNTATTGFISAKLEPVMVNAVTDQYLVVRFRRARAADDVTVTAGMSTDIQAWTPLTDHAADPVENADGTDELALRSPLPVTSPGHRYVRVTVATRP